MSRGSHFVRRLLRGDESARAREWQSRALAQANARDHEDVARFRAVMACKPGDRRVLLGRARDLSGEPFWCGLPYEEVLGKHSWITGATGSGKTFATIAWLLQVLRDGRFPVVVVDLKSELSELLIELVVPTLVQARGGERLLNRLRIIRPFARDLPMLRVTE
ncbi:MAG: DEAD/DEAH box helicase family protein, partial [Candidatus Eisenbacteria bacterium]|nr:DEAD/DEAH box helicase family protein [Candidatus Eisenbacteria bacterium]